MKKKKKTKPKGLRGKMEELSLRTTDGNKKQKKGESGGWVEKAPGRRGEIHIRLKLKKEKNREKRG